MERKQDLLRSNDKPTAEPEKGRCFMVTEEDRQLVRRELGSMGHSTSIRTGPASNNAHTSPQARSTGQAAHPKSKFIKEVVGTPHDPAHAKPQSVLLATVQDDRVVMKEWSGLRGGGEDSFKSPSLFWEIRLKESTVRASEHARQSKTSSVFQIVEACDMLDQLTGRDLASIDPSVFEKVKEQIFSAIFADYEAISKIQGAFKTKLALFQSCVPYSVIAERQFSTIQLLEAKLNQLKQQLIESPQAKSFTNSGTQTSTSELDKSSGVNALRDRIDQMQAIILDLSAEKFEVQLNANQAVNDAKGETTGLRDQLERITARSDAVQREAETIRGKAENTFQRAKELEDQNEKLWSRSTELDHSLSAVKREYKDFSAQMMYTLDTERKRFKQERSWWLDSFVAERYELLNSMEAVQNRLDQEAKKAKKGRKKKNAEADADRAALWQSLLEIGALTRERLEGLYWEQDTVKIKDQKEYTKRVWDTLRDQEAAVESCVLTSPQVKKWNAPPVVQAAQPAQASGPVRRTRSIERTRSQRA